MGQYLNQTRQKRTQKKRDRVGHSPTASKFQCTPKAPSARGGEHEARKACSTVSKQTPKKTDRVGHIPTASKFQCTPKASGVKEGGRLRARLEG